MTQRFPVSLNENNRQLRRGGGIGRRYPYKILK